MCSPFVPPPFFGRWPSFTEGFTPEIVEHRGVSVGGIDVIDAVFGIHFLLNRPEQGTVVVRVHTVVVVEVVVDKFVNHGVDPFGHQLDGCNLDGDISLLSRDSACLAVEDDVPPKTCIFLALVRPKSTG